MRITKRVILFVASLLAAAGAEWVPAVAQDAKHVEARTGAGRTYLERLYAEENREYRFRTDFPGGFESWQTRARPVLQSLLGLDTMARQVGADKPRVVLETPQDRETHILRKGFIETEPAVRIAFWLLRPRGEGPFPLAITPHGHDRRGHDTSAGVYHDAEHRSEALAADRDVAVQAVERGFLAIAPATRGLSREANFAPDEYARHGKQDCRSHLNHALLAKRTAMGERVWDMSRLLDWALELPDVDRRTVLMMGNSGGGMVTIYAAACDRRITIAVPSCSFTRIASPEGRIFHCDCNTVPGILRFGDLYDVAGLVAPRFVLAVNGRKDSLHEATAIEDAARRAKASYEAAGVPERFEHRWGDEGHRFYKELMWPFVLQAMKR